jgi:hypothetical protein
LVLEVSILFEPHLPSTSFTCFCPCLFSFNIGTSMLLLSQHSSHPYLSPQDLDQLMSKCMVGAWLEEPKVKGAIFMEINTSQVSPGSWDNRFMSCKGYGDVIQARKRIVNVVRESHLQIAKTTH